MGAKLTEGKFLFYIMLGISLLVIIRIFHFEFATLLNQDNFLSIHIILEFFSIAVSFLIFSYGWQRYTENRSMKLLLLALVFLSVGLIDLLHTLTYKGMPQFITESSIAKATWFWIIARFIEASLMVMVLLLPDRKVNRDFRYVLLFVCLIVVTVIAYIIFAFESRLPLLVIEGEGTTPLKNTFEYIISGLHFLSIIISLHLYNKNKKESHLYLTLAFTFLFMSEMIFTIYQSVYDIDNFTGHLYKVIGYFFIMRGFYFSRTLEFNQTKQSEADRMIQEHSGIIFKVKKVQDNYIHYVYGGSLLKEYELSPENINGKALEQLVPDKAEIIFNYYDLAWSSKERVSFEIKLAGALFIVSIKPIVSEDHVNELIGSVMEVSNNHYYQEGYHKWKNKYLG